MLVEAGLLTEEQLEKAITEQLRQSFNSEVAVENIQWKWLPLPHLSIINADIFNEYSRISLPKINIYPINWTKMAYPLW